MSVLYKEVPEHGGKMKKDKKKREREREREREKELTQPHEFLFRTK